MEPRERLPFYRFATADEIRGYLVSHETIFLELIQSLERMEIDQDEIGDFLRFLLREDPEDTRQVTVEQAAGAMEWPSNDGPIRIRVKGEFIDDPMAMYNPMP